MQTGKDISQGDGRGASPVEVVLVNYNSTDALLGALGSVYRVLGPETVVRVQDNASSDRPQRIAHHFPQASLQLNQANLGFAKAVNQALAGCRASYVMLLNPDTVLSGQHCRDLWEFLEQNPEIGVLGPRILDPDGSVQGSARGFHTLATALAGRKGPLTRLFPNSRLARQDLPVDPAACSGPLEVDWVSGACMVVRRAAMEAVGGLDERFFMYFEDTDWCRRMKEAGWKTVYYPGMSVVHMVGVSSDTRPLRCTWEFHKSCYRYMGKYWLRRRPWAKPFAAGLLGGRLLAVASWQAARAGWQAGKNRINRQDREGETDGTD